MGEVIGSIWWLLVALGLLITFHEFGHFWVARRLGVRVLRFSVGFGKPIWSRRGSDDTEYAVAAIPLGGYVKMLDEREGEVPPDQLDQAFNRKPVWARIAIVAAGPIFNLVFAVLAFWLMFLVGIPESRPVIGGVSGIALEAGIEPGDAIVAVDESDTRTWSHAMLELVTHALDRNNVDVTVENADGIRSEHTLELAALGADFSEEKTLEAIGLEPWRLEIPPVIGEVTNPSPAYQAGLYEGDRILSIAGEEVLSWSWIGHLVQTHGIEGEPLSITVDRDGTQLELEVRPRKEKSGWFSSRLLLGIRNAEISSEQRASLDRAAIVLRLGPLEGLQAAVKETWRLTGSTLGLLGRMITGKASVKNLSGPISIAQFANTSASAGLSHFLFFLGAISLSLGILNLLPIPVLDGGHLLYYLIELVKGSPVSDQAQIAGQYFGLIALAGLMSLAFVNDILRLVG
ncbi:MAG: RIP metalloprotease RseP [Gammaproteobacteria bacterium]|jgi:regulator of sigma E protease|nr:RIP metalloprotease RseP [Gammaproteobacteria bacterium]